MGTRSTISSTLLDLEQLEVNLFRGVSPDEDRAARLRRPGRGAGAGRRGPHGRPRPPGALAARVLPAARRPDGPDRLRRRPHPRRPQLHDPPRRRDPARQAIFNLSASFHVDEAGPDHHDADARRARPRDAADDPRADRRRTATASRRARVEWLDARAADRHAPRRQRPAAGCDPGRRASPTRTCGSAPNGTLPDDPLLHACVVAYASDLTLLDTAMLPHAIDRDDDRLHDREPRPRDVVPPAVPRRRVAAVPPAQPVGRGAARGLADGLHLPRRRHARGDA